MKENRDLIDAATRGEWTLDHDKKMLDIMQNIASVCAGIYFFIRYFH